MRTDTALVPSLWWFELRNTLIVSERRGCLTETDTALFLRQIARLPIGGDRSPGEAEVLMLARQHRLTVYDASYLELARREGVPLATLDDDLRGAGKAARTSLLEKRPSA